MNFSVCDNQQNVVKRLIQLLLDRIYHLVQEVREIGRPAQRYIWQVGSVGLQDALGSVNVWIHWVSIEIEAMRDRVGIEKPGDASETINREALIVIIHLQYRAH